MRMDDPLHDTVELAGAIADDDGDGTGCQLDGWGLELETGPEGPLLETTAW